MGFPARRHSEDQPLPSRDDGHFEINRALYSVDGKSYATQNQSSREIFGHYQRSNPIIIVNPLVQVVIDHIGDDELGQNNICIEESEDDHPVKRTAALRLRFPLVTITWGYQIFRFCRKHLTSLQATQPLSHSVDKEAEEENKFKTLWSCGYCKGITSVPSKNLNMPS